MPEYEVIRWDESNFDTNACAYVREAVGAKKWAFASDYARFKILYEHGGVYLDTDVELLKSMDPILQEGPFMGLETDAGFSVEGSMVPGLGLAVNPGLGIAANPGMGLYKTILDSYEADHFIKNGIYDQTTVVVRTTSILKRYGLHDIPGIQEVAGIKIYPAEYFCPKDFLSERINITDNTYSIHHFDGTWAGPFTRFKHKIMRLVGPLGVNRFKAIKQSVRGRV